MEIVLGLSFLGILLVLAAVLWGTGALRPLRGNPATHTKVRHPNEVGRTSGLN